MSDLNSRAVSLYNSLGDFKATDRFGAPIGQMYAALLIQAKQELPESPLIQALQPLAQDVTGGYRERAGDLKAVIDQILVELDEAGPSIG